MFDNPSIDRSNPKMKDEPIGEFLKEKHEMQQCCYDNLETPRRVGRCHLLCPECGRDITLAAILYADTVEQEQGNKYGTNRQTTKG